jgi:hypothetical protein
MTAPARLARLLDDRFEAGQTRDLLGTAERARLTDLGEQVAGEDRPDPVYLLHAWQRSSARAKRRSSASTVATCASSAAITASNESTCRRACSDRRSAAAERNPSALSSRDRKHGHSFTR